MNQPTNQSTDRPPLCSNRPNQQVDERYDRAAGSGADRRQPDILDNAFAVVNFEGGIRGCLDLCMFAEDRQHEEVG